VLVPYKSYITALEEGTSIAQVSTSSKVIKLPNQVGLEPGENEFEIAWTAAVAGQFVLTQVSVTYKAATFLYTYERMKEPFRIDVIPGMPTQTMDVKPTFLVPGHEQKLSIQFNSGKDQIVKGELNLVCSPGLLIRPLESEETGWSSACKFSLDSCPPDTLQELTAMVKSASDQSADDPNDSGSDPSVHAKVKTSYCLANKQEDNVLHREIENDDVFNTQFQHELEKVIPTLADPALSVENVSLNTYAVGRSLLSVSAKCHVPAPFKLNQWDLELPPRLKLNENSKMDKALAGVTLEKGEIATFGFDCSYEPSGEGASSESFLVTEMEDQYKSQFTERLHLRLKNMSLVSANLPEKVHSLFLEGQLITVSTRQVGVPMRLQYEMDLSPLAGWNGTIHFALDSNSDGWLLCGSTKGLVELVGSQKWTHDKMAIPTRPDAFDELPMVEFIFTGDKLEKPFRITIPTRQSPPMESPKIEDDTIPLNHSSVAFLTATRYACLI